jgi:tRNA-specific 2-thiouridylase
MNSKRVVVAMSGGVDSSVAASLLVEQGYDVIGMMLRLWSEPGKENSNRCCTPDAMGQARRVAAQLGIPFYAIDARQEFHDTVVEYFTQAYQRGLTPNPCLVCNRQIRWGLLQNKALEFGADFFATGHYARIEKRNQGFILKRSVDTRKDQSYVLHVLKQKDLKRTLLPIGGYAKSTIRELARRFSLPVAERKDSQDLCFLAGDNYRNFLIRNAPDGIRNPGKIVSPDGLQLGEHQGLAFYTIGQRKGLNLASSIPLYVVGKDITTNTLLVGPSSSLSSQSLIADGVNWISDRPPGNIFRADVKIRYTAKEFTATVSIKSNNCVQVEFDEPLRDITPGQAAVFYDGDNCLGGGIIQP